MCYSNLQKKYSVTVLNTRFFRKMYVIEIYPQLNPDNSNPW